MYSPSRSSVAALHLVAVVFIAVANFGAFSAFQYACVNQNEAILVCLLSPVPARHGRVFHHRSAGAEPSGPRTGLAHEVAATRARAEALVRGRAFI